MATTKNPWQEIYDAAEAEAEADAVNEGHSKKGWWRTNDDGWCPNCHKHRHNAGWWEGKCFACDTPLNEVKDEFGPHTAPNGFRGAFERRYAWCPECRLVRTLLDSDYDNDGKPHCYSCKGLVEPYAKGFDPYGYGSDDDDGKELWWIMNMPDIVVEQDAHDYAMEVVGACPGEVGGLGFVERQENGDLLIYEFCLIEQEVSSGGVEFNDDAMHKFLIESAERPDADNLRLSWHSHGNMSPFFSATDTGDAITKYKEMGIPWLLSLIFNRKGEISTRLDIFDSEAIDQVYLEKLTYRLDRAPAIVEQAQKDVKELVHPARPTQAPKKNGAGSGSPSKSKADTGKKKDPERKQLPAGDQDAEGKAPLPENIRGPLAKIDKGQKPTKSERKSLRRYLVQHSDFSPAEVRQMGMPEVAECLHYLALMASRKNGHGVLTVGDDLPDEFEGKKVADLTEAEWVRYCDANDIELDPTSRRMLLAAKNDDWGGTT